MKLELKNICQAYDGKSVIKDMNLEFEPGIYGFLGPNGAGKSGRVIYATGGMIHFTLM